MADNVTSNEPSPVALFGSFLLGAVTGAAGVTVAPLVVMAVAVALVVGGDLMASREPEGATPRAVPFLRAGAAGLGLVAAAFVLLNVLNY